MFVSIHVHFLFFWGAVRFTESFNNIFIYNNFVRSFLLQYEQILKKELVPLNKDVSGIIFQYLPTELLIILKTVSNKFKKFIEKKILPQRQLKCRLCRQQFIYSKNELCEGHLSPPINRSQWYKRGNVAAMDKYTHDKSGCMFLSHVEIELFWKFHSIFVNSVPIN